MSGEEMVSLVRHINIIARDIAERNPGDLYAQGAADAMSRLLDEITSEEPNGQVGQTGQEAKQDA